MEKKKEKKKRIWEKEATEGIVERSGLQWRN